MLYLQVTALFLNRCFRKPITLKFYGNKMYLIDTKLEPLIFVSQEYALQHGGILTQIIIVLFNLVGY